MRNDFNTIKNEIKNKVEELNLKDANYTWRCKVTTSEIKIWWQYLSDLTYGKECFKITSSPYDFEGEEVIYLHDAEKTSKKGELIDCKELDRDGSLEECVNALLDTLNHITQTEW